MEQLFIGLTAGCIGTGFLIYGKKQKRVVPFACGLALMVYPYFIEDVAWCVAVGVLLCALPWFIRR